MSIMLVDFNTSVLNWSFLCLKIYISLFVYIFTTVKNIAVVPLSGWRWRWFILKHTSTNTT